MKAGYGYVFLVVFMAIVATACGSSYEDVSDGVQAKMEESRLKLIDWLGSADREIFAPEAFLAQDTVEFGDGSVVEGKVLDYGPYICVVDKTKRWVLRRSDARNITMSWGETPPEKPEVPDLDVTFIERLPRYRSNHNNVRYDGEKGILLDKPNTDPVWPSKGTKATFKGHVVNKGPVDGKPFKYEWYVDGKRKDRGKHDAIGAGQEAVIDFDWRWQEGAHDVSLKVIPDGEDFSAWNNTHTDRTDSLGLLIVASQHAYDGFNGNLNMVESFSFEDWMQYHLQVMNFLFKASIYPGSPTGCMERVRIDMVMVIPDEGYRETFEGLGRDENYMMYYEGKWGFTPWDKYDWRAENIDWGLIHELGHQLGLIDYYTIDLPRDRVYAKDNDGQLIDVGHMFPYTGMMRGHGPHAFTEATAIALNWERGKHRGFFGAHLFRLPDQCGIRIVDFMGRPVADAELRIFRRSRGKFNDRETMWTIPEDPIWEGKTDENGTFMLPNEEPPFVFTTENGFTRGASPFGDALVISDTGLLLVEIWKNGRRDAQWTNVTEFMVGYGRGHHGRYVDDIETILSADADEDEDASRPMAPRITEVSADGWSDRTKVKWSGVPGSDASAYRLYFAHYGLPISRGGMSEFATVKADRPFGISFLNGGQWFLMTGIDKYGNESAPSEPTYVARRFFSRMAVSPQGEVYSADWGINVVDGRGFIRPFPYRTSDGIVQVNSLAFSPGGDLLALSRDTGRVYVLDQDGIEKSYFPKAREGEAKLEKPSDMCVGPNGEAIVADTENNRIIVFGAEGSIIATISGSGMTKPVAVDVDASGNVYVIQSGKPGVMKVAKSGDTYGQAVQLVETKEQPLDVLCGGEGMIYVSQKGEPGLIALNSEGEPAGSLDAWNGKGLRSVTGMALDKSGNLVCGMGQTGELLRIPAADLVRE